MKRFLKVFAETICIVLTAVMLPAGCDTPITAETEITADEDGVIPMDISGSIITADEGAADAAEMSDYPVTINNTVISDKPATAICLSSSLTEIIYELGYGDRLIGRGSYCNYPEDVLELADFGRPASPDLDAIKRAAPDVLITATAIPNIDTVSLSDIGISVVYIPSPHSLDEFGRIYKAVGMIFDGLFAGSERGSSAYYNISNILGGSDITLGNFIYITEGLAAAGGDTFESSILSVFGTNLAAEASGYSFDKTALADDQPDTVIINSELSYDDIAEDSVLGGLDAVQAGNIVKIDNAYFESPSGRITNIINELNEAEVKQ